VSRRSERHARSKDCYDAQPSRSAERADAATAGEREPTTRAPARKDTRSWCHGKPGNAHVPVLTSEAGTPQDPGCRWSESFIWPGGTYGACWKCRHREECARCGKILRVRSELADAECPDYPGDPAEREAAEAAAAQRARSWSHLLSRYRQYRKPVITGPQGYRRRRKETT
jgi:hypothetical protein